MNNLISPAFWFNSRPELITDTGEKVLVSIATLLVLAIILISIKAYSKAWSIYRPTLERLIPFAYTNALIALYFIFLNDQTIPVLRSRYWYVIWVAIAIWWLIVLYREIAKRAQRKQEFTHEAERKKYLPS